MSIIHHAPGFSPQEAVEIVRERYGIEASAKPLPSERDQNFLIATGGGERFVLKVANALEEKSALEAQNLAMRHLNAHRAPCPQVQPDRSGALISEVLTDDGKKHFVRLLTYLPGMPMGELRRQSGALLYDLGRCLGRMDRALANFDHPATHRRFHWDLARGLSVIDQYRDLVTDTQLLELIDHFVADVERIVVPLLPDLRRSVIHNDANNFNVIVGGGENLYDRNQNVLGVIDYGDMVFSYTICNPAIAIAYAILDKPDPLNTAAHVVGGYHGTYPLRENEIQALFGMVCLRLCVSACIAAHQMKQRPDDAYLAVSQQPIRKMLPKLARIQPKFAEATFRRACGLSPWPETDRVVGWLQRNHRNMAPVLGFALDAASCLVLDLGIGSPLVSGDPAANAEPVMTRRLFQNLQAENVRVGIGRYDEARLIYSASIFTAASDAAEDRTVHLGMDLFTDPGTPVCVPLDGIIEAFASNGAELDYGHVIIVKHPIIDGHCFYTLYGHLGNESLEGLQAGQPVKKGQQIATIGTPAVNGGWSPHLHFQIIIDLLDYGCDFPGVCAASQRHIWQAFCPDPNFILQVDPDLFPRLKNNKARTLAARKKYVGRNLSIGYRDPVKIERGWMQYLYDDTGRRFLDAYNNVPHVGHCHPEVIAAGRRQMTVLNTNTRYLHDFMNLFAERLGATMPDPLRVCFFVNSASEGNELALRLARAHTRQRDMIVLDGAYHGHTTTLIDISPYKHAGPGGIGAPAWVHTAPVADLYRGAYRSEDPEAAEKYARHVGRIISDLQAEGRGPAGFIAESCPSVGGQIIFPRGYLARVYQHVRAAGGVCIADEVQTAYGRTGTHFYAFEAQGVVPDIVVLGKPIGNGHPISAVVTTPEIAASFDNGMEFFSTFGGNTVSCAIGLAVLNVTLAENLQSHALRVGNRMLAGLRPFKDRFQIVGDVRGSGLFLGVELVRDCDTLEPAGAEAAFIADRMRAYGILMGTDGPFHNVVKIRPPMPFSESDADRLVGTMEKILLEDFSCS